MQYFPVYVILNFNTQKVGGSRWKMEKEIIEQQEKYKKTWF